MILFAWQPGPLWDRYAQLLSAAVDDPSNVEPFVSMNAICPNAGNDIAALTECRKMIPLALRKVEPLHSLIERCAELQADVSKVEYLRGWAKRQKDGIEVDALDSQLATLRAALQAAEQEIIDAEHENTRTMSARGQLQWRLGPGEFDGPLKSVIRAECAAAGLVL